jgi:hypothetical protein
MASEQAPWSPPPEAASLGTGELAEIVAFIDGQAETELSHDNACLFEIRVAKFGV